MLSSDPYCVQVVWYRHTMKLIDSSHLHMLNVGDTYKLVMGDIKTQNWGQYHCQASNSLGETSGSITLTGMNIIIQFSKYVNGLLTCDLHFIMVLDDTDLMENLVFMFCFFSIYIHVLFVRSEEKSLKKIDIFFFW